MNITESNHLVKLLRYLFDPDTQVPSSMAAEAVEYLAQRACTSLQTGLSGPHAAQLFATYVTRRQEDARWNEAVDWLLNCSATAEDAVQTGFRGIADGWCTREQATAGFIDGRSIVDIGIERDA